MRDENNDAVVNGVTFNENMDELIKYPASKKGTFYYVPESVGRINDSAFCNCKNLVSIFIPADVYYIGYGAFNGCDNLKEFIVSEENRSFRSCHGKLHDNKGKDMTAKVFIPDIDYVIPKKITSITGFENHSMGNGNDVCMYQSSGDGSIAVNGTVKSITIHKRVTNIDKNLFYIFNRAKFFDVDEENKHFKSIDGVLFSKDGKRLIAYPAAKPGSEYTVPDGVTKIEEGAFSECGQLDTINLPDSVTTIGRYAFYATGITECIVPPRVKRINKRTFAECSMLSHVELPEGLKLIDDEAFSECSIGEIKLPESLEIIGKGAFEDNYLKTIKLGANIHTILPSTFAFNNLEEIELGEGVSFIGENAFRYNPVQTLNIPDNVKSIDAKAFDSCNSLETVHLGSGLLNIAYGAFLGCEMLSNVTVDKNNPKYKSIDNIVLGRNTSDIELLPEGVKIPNRVITEHDGVLFVGKILFRYPAEKLDKSYTIPDWVDEIDSFAFDECKHLEEIVFSANTMLSGLALRSCTSIKKAVIPEGITSIGYREFAGCKNLVQVVLPSTLETIGEGAFKECENLKEINLPDGLHKICFGAFESCSKLKAIRIPGSVNAISERAFYNCSGLKSLTMENGIATICKEAFCKCNNLTEVRIPESVTKIEEGAFHSCIKLRKLVLSNSAHVTERWLSGCESLSELVYADGTPVTTLHSWSFEDSNYGDIPF